MVLPGPWDSFVWLPFADGKVRRAPDDSFRMAHGLPVELLEGVAPEDAEPKRSIIGALGNSIVWPLATRLIAAMMEAEGE
jgi:hypothetical protein